MDEKRFEQYQERVHEKITEINRDIIPPSWWDTVIKYHYDHGFSEERTAQIILETIKKVDQSS